MVSSAVSATVHYRERSPRNGRAAYLLRAIRYEHGASLQMDMGRWLGLDRVPG